MNEQAEAGPKCDETAHGGEGRRGRELKTAGSILSDLDPDPGGARLLEPKVIHTAISPATYLFIPVGRMEERIHEPGVCRL